MLSTVTDGQAIDKERSVKPQVKDISVKPQAKDNSVKPKAKANARSLSAGDASSQTMIRTGDTGAVDIEATSGSYQLVTGSQGDHITSRLLPELYFYGLSACRRSDVPSKKGDRDWREPLVSRVPPSLPF